jgi:hypothetical protein
MEFKWLCLTKIEARKNWTYSGKSGGKSLNVDRETFASLTQRRSSLEGLLNQP